MLFCNRGSKSSAPLILSQKSQGFSSSRFSNYDLGAEESYFSSNVTTGSVDKISVSNSTLPEVPVMPLSMKAQLAQLSNKQMSDDEGRKTERNPRHSNGRPKQLITSASMHCFDSSFAIQNSTRNHISNKSSANLSAAVDGNICLPISCKKNYYSGLRLPPSSHLKPSISTLDAQQLSVLLDFEERCCDPWVGSISLRRTAKPNLENERHRENSLFLSILEAKGLQSKRKYFCDICLDRTLYARTTSKQPTGNDIFWAEEFDLNNLPDVSILTMKLYYESVGGMKDGKRGLIARSSGKKASKKFPNRLVGFATIPVSNLCSRNPSQMWLALQPPENADSMNSILLSPGNIVSTSFGTIPSTTCVDNATGGSGVQLRVSIRYKSIEILPISVYHPLYTLVRGNGIEFTEWFEYLIPLKLKEEVASSFVNLHELDGTATYYLSKLVTREVSSLQNESMTFRSNTMATKAVESYIKLVGKEYLHNLLYRYIQQVLICSETWEVDPGRLPTSSVSSGTLLAPGGHGTSAPATQIIRNHCARKRMSSSNYEQPVPSSGLSRLAVLNNGRVALPGSLVYSQTQLLQHLDFVWDTLYASRSYFPKPLLEMFSSFRTALQPIKGAEFCDKLISACIFLRFICPAILTPSLFGLASTFPSESNCQRNLTLVAKSLQSLANLSAFGEKEPFMRFMNAYVELQIPMMRSFLREISSVPNVLEQKNHAASSVAINIDSGYELACLQNICHEIFNSSTSQHPSSTTLSIFAVHDVNAPVSSLPPPLVHLPEIIDKIEKLKLATAIGSEFTDAQAISNLENPPVNLNERLLASTVEYSTSVKNEFQNPPSDFCLSVEEPMLDFASNVEINALNSPFQMSGPVRPTKIRMQTPSPSIHQPPQGDSLRNDAFMTLTGKVTTIEEKENVRATLNDILKISAFVNDSEASNSAKSALNEDDVDYDDPYIDEAYDSASSLCMKTIYDIPYEDDTCLGTQKSIDAADGLQCPSSQSAFSLCRLPLTTKSISFSVSSSAVPRLESASSPFTTPLNTACASSSALAYPATPIAPDTHSSFRNSRHHRREQAKGLVEASSGIASTSHTTKNLILKPLPSPTIKHFKPRLARCSTTFLSSPSSILNEDGLNPQQHVYSSRQLFNINRASRTSGQKMVPSVNTIPLQKSYDCDNESNPKVLEATKDSRTNCATACFTLGTRRALATKRSNGLIGDRCHPSPPQTLVITNEQLLTSTLEELGDAVAWLENESNDLLNMQEHRLSSSDPRSQPDHINSFDSLSLPCKCPVLTINPPAASNIILTPSAGDVSAQQHIGSTISTPLICWSNNMPSLADKASALSKSAISLAEQIIPQHRPPQSSLSETFALTRSYSASVSPSRKLEGSSDSSGNTGGLKTCGQRNTALCLVNKATPTSVRSNGWHRLSSQKPVEMGTMRCKVGNSDELDESDVLHQYRHRKHPASFVSTSNRNILMHSNPSPPPITAAIGEDHIQGIEAHSSSQARF